MNTVLTVAGASFRMAGLVIEPNHKTADAEADGGDADGGVSDAVEVRGKVRRGHRCW